MEKKRLFTTKNIVGLALLIAVEIALQAIGNNISFGPISINLTLVPICIAAILYGPLGGLFLGIINGIIVLVSPSTLAVFMPINAWGTVLTCLIKSSIAGLAAGFIFKAFKNHEYVGCVITSICVPIINTGLFSGFCFLFFQDFLKQQSGYQSLGAALFFGVIGFNFIFEFATSVILSPIIYRLINLRKIKE